MKRKNREQRPKYYHQSTREERMEDQNFIHVGNLYTYKEIVSSELIQANSREMSSNQYNRGCANWKNKALRQYAIYTCQKKSRSLIVNGFIKDKPTSITVDMGPTVSNVCPDLMKYLRPIWYSCTLQTATGRLVKSLWNSGDTPTPGSS